jgi:hypothetical protein
VGVLTMGGDEGRQPDFNGARRRSCRQALFSKCGSAPLAPQRRKARLGNQLNVANLMTASACSQRRRIGAANRRGRRRPALFDSDGGARRCRMAAEGAGAHQGGPGRLPFIGADPRSPGVHAQAGRRPASGRGGHGLMGPARAGGWAAEMGRSGSGRAHGLRPKG